MNIVKRIDQYDESNCFFCEPIKNNVMNDGNFIRIIYSTHNVTLNSIYLLLTLNDISFEKYYSKYKCNFNVVNHKDIIDNLKIIEEELLKKCEIKDKIPQFKINEQLKNGNLKIFTDTGNKLKSSFILKISGIWETQYNYGLTYKFIKIN
jgi:Zn-dependent M16 (insulinase) family peptidase